MDINSGIACKRLSLTTHYSGITYGWLDCSPFFTVGDSSAILDRCDPRSQPFTNEIACRDPGISNERESM